MRTLPLLLSIIPFAAHAETVRSVLASDQPGSVQKPIDLTDAKTVAGICAEVQKRSPIDPDDDSAEADQKSQEWEASRKLTFAKVYRAAIDPKSVRFEPYDVEEGALPIALQKSLSSLDGALVLSVMEREGASFDMSVDDSKKLIERAANKELRVLITFQIDDQHAEEVSPCWSYPKSESWSLRVMPLRFELTDTAGKSIASVTTERMERIGEWLGKPGQGVSISTSVVNGVVDQAALDKAIGEKKSAIGACIGKAGDTATFGISAGVAGGKLGDLRVEMEASDDPSASGCIVSALAGTPAPKASANAAVSVLVTVD